MCVFRHTRAACSSADTDTRHLPLLSPAGAATTTVYNFTDKGITWNNERKKYTNTPGYASPEAVLPPPNWALRYPNGYTNATGFPKLQDDEHFQVWMRTAGLPTFRKLFYRNDGETLRAGRYSIQIFMSESVFPPFPLLFFFHHPLFSSLPPARRR